MTSPASAARRCPLALVQHGTDAGSGNWAPVVALHLHAGIPLNLRLGGRRLEALAAQTPEIVDWLRALDREGLLELVGSGYAGTPQMNVSHEHNLRRLNETLALFRLHLGVAPEAVHGFWAPSGVEPELAELLRSERLANGGYSWLLVGPGGGDPTSALPSVPVTGPLFDQLTAKRANPATRLTQLLAETDDGQLIVVSDDLDHAASLAAPRDGDGLNTPAGRLLEHLAAQADLEPVLLTTWLASSCSSSSSSSASSSSASASARPEALRPALIEAESRLLAAAPPTAAPPAPGAGLWDLAWKQLLVAAATDDPAHDGDALVTAAAAEWAERVVPEPGGNPAPAEIDVYDIDGDGHDEVVLRNRHLFAVVAPRSGARVTHLYALAGGDGWLVLGPDGAMGDAGHEHDRWELVTTRPGPAQVEAVLGHIQARNPLQGALKTFSLGAAARGVAITYRLPAPQVPFHVDSALAPHRLNRLRAVPEPVVATGRGRRRGLTAGSAGVWLELGDGEPVVWGRRRVGPGDAGLRISAWDRRFLVTLGVGPRPGEEILDLRDAAALVPEPQIPEPEPTEKESPVGE